MNHLSTLNAIYYTDQAFLLEIKKEFFAMYRRNGKSKWAKKSFEDHISIGLPFEDRKLGILDYRFTKKSESYFENKASICRELDKKRRSL